MADPELSGDVTGPDPIVGQLYYPLSDHVGQGTAVHENSAKLVHSTMTCKTETDFVTAEQG